MPVAQEQTYFVDGNSSVCTDAGPGSAETPFCTVKRSAALALPGDVVFVANGRYGDFFRFSTSGTPEQPITFWATGDDVVLGTFVGRQLICVLERNVGSVQIAPVS